MKQESLFTQKVREVAKMVPVGKVITYGMLAEAAGGGRLVPLLFLSEGKGRFSEMCQIVLSQDR